MREKCEDELKKILGTEELDPSSSQYFQKRMVAVKRVMDGLTPPRLAQIDAEVKRIKETGLDVNTQRRSVVFM